jgi:hypothetical protein
MGFPLETTGPLPSPLAGEGGPAKPGRMRGRSTVPTAISEEECQRSGARRPLTPTLSREGRGGRSSLGATL